MRSDIEFEASSSVSSYFIKAPLHSSQTSEETTGKTLFKLKVHNETEFARYLLRFGQAVRILAPESAVAEMKRFLDTMRDFYSDGSTLSLDPEPRQE